MEGDSEVELMEAAELEAAGREEEDEQEDVEAKDEL